MNENMRILFYKRKIKLRYNNEVILVSAVNNSFIKMSGKSYKIINEIIKSKQGLSSFKSCFESLKDYNYIKELLSLLIANKILTYEFELEEGFEEISLIITRNCNLKCIHCCEDAICGDENSELSLERWKEIIDIVCSKKINLITITGGEPILRSDFKEITTYLRKNFTGKIQLLTNGTLINEKNIKWLCKNIDIISISLDGYEKELTDKIRGKGSYTKIINGINLLKAYNFEKISISALLPNCREITKEFDDFCTKLKVRKVQRFLSLSGRAEKNEETINHIFREYISVNNYELEDNLKKMGVQIADSCKAYDGKLSIDYLGDIYPCNLIRKNKYCVGNILEDNNILNNYKNTKEYLNFNSLKNYELNKCKDCPVNCFCWSCLDDYINTIKDRSKFEERCKIRKKYLMEKIWDETVD